jgi:hypothetical protein
MYRTFAASLALVSVGLAAAAAETQRVVFQSEVAEHKWTASVKATPSFQPAHAFDAVGVWTNNDNDQRVGEAARKPTSWRLSMKRAG